MGQIGWMLSLIPDTLFIWIYYIMLTLGVGLYVASKLIKWLPMMGQYKLPAELVGVVSVSYTHLTLPTIYSV